MKKSFWQTNFALINLIIVAIAMLLRLPQLTGSFWMDEAAQALESARPLSQQLQIRDDFQPPLLHLITHFALSFSQAEWWLRTWGALIPALLSIWLLPKLVLAIFSTKKSDQSLTPYIIGWLAALWLATNSFHVFFSQELRPYSLAAWWAVLSWWLIVARKPSWQFVLASLAGLYSTYLYPFVLIGQFAYLCCWHRETWKTHLLAASAITLGFLPWLPSFFGQLQAGQQLRFDLPGWESVVSFSQLKVLPLVAAKWLFGVRDLSLSFSWLLKIGVIVILIFWLIVKNWQSIDVPANFRKSTNRLFRLLIGWGVIPLLLAWVVSFWVPVIQPKRVLWLWPIAAIAVSWLIVHGAKQKNLLTRSAATVLLAMLFTFNLSGLYDYYTNRQVQREDWRGLQQKITKGYSPASTVLVFGFPVPFASWQWYDRQTFHTINTGYLAGKTREFAHQQLNGITEYRFVLVFDYLRTLTDPQNLILASLEAAGYKGVGVIDTPNVGFVRIYARRESLLGANSNEQSAIINQLSIVESQTP